MPNWVTTKIKFTGKEVGKFLERFKSEDNPFSFDKIIPMPSNIYRGALGIEEEKKYGKNNWYNWSCENWGTKWDTCHTELKESADSENITVTYDTAWAFADKPLLRLSEIIKEEKLDIDFDGSFFNEDTGAYSAGTFDCICGDFKVFYAETDSDAYKIRIEIEGNNDCIGKDADGNYYHYDCEHCPNKCY